MPNKSDTSENSFSSRINTFVGYERINKLNRIKHKKQRTLRSNKKWIKNFNRKKHQAGIRAAKLRMKSMKDQVEKQEVCCHL